MKRLAIACALLASAWTALPASPQTRSIYSNLANPAIGFNALFLDQVAPDLDQPYGPRFQESEMSLISVVDPYWLLEANIVFAPDGVDPEEVWARTSSIPGIQLKLGKIRASFGKHGQLHTHAFPFVQAPVIMANTIGEEGFKDAGLEASWLTPLPWYAEVIAGAYQAEAPDDENPLDFGSPAHGNIPYLGRLKNVFDLNDETTVEVGVSALRGLGEDGHPHAAYGADLTVRNVPLRNSNRRGWIVQAEYLEKGTYAAGYRREAHGGYLSFQDRLAQRWWAGVRAEQARDSFTDVLVDDAGDPVAGKVTRASVNVAWTPTEFSFVRLEYSYAKADGGSGFKPKDQRLMVQMDYTVGYHPAHAY